MSPEGSKETCSNTFFISPDRISKTFPAGRAGHLAVQDATDSFDSLGRPVRSEQSSSIQVRRVIRHV